MYSKTKVLLACFLCVFASQADAQKAPELGYIFPPVVQAGKQTNVLLGGYDFTPDMRFFTHDKDIDISSIGKLGDFLVPKPPYWFGEKGRLSAFPIPREIPAAIEIPSGFPYGPVQWQAANANGSSAAAIFFVSETAEIVEKRFRQESQVLTEFPIGVSGRLERITEVDRYEFAARKNGLITIQLLARGLGTEMNGVLQIHDSNGKLIADTIDTEGIDPAITFAVKNSQKYTVSLHDLDYRGHSAMVYHLAFSEGPRVIGMIPSQAIAGKESTFEVMGYGIATGKPKLETLRTTIDASKQLAGTKISFRLRTPYGIAPAMDIPITNSGHEIQTRVIDQTGESVHFFEAEKGQLFEVAAESTVNEDPMDLALVIQNEDGQLIGENDDFNGSFNPRLQIATPKAGRYQCTIRDLSGKPWNCARVYRLSIRPHDSDFSISVPQQINIPIGGSFQIPLKVKRFGNHQAAIQIRAFGLTEGISVEGTPIIPEGKNVGKLTLKVAPTSAAKSQLITISGVSPIDGIPESRFANATSAGSLVTGKNNATQTKQLLLTTTLVPHFSVQLVDKNRQRAVHRGTTYPAPFIIKRTDGFSGPVYLMMAAKQGRHRQGISAPIILVRNKQETVEFPCWMPEWLETDRTTRMVVLGMAQQADPKGNLHFVTQLADSRITMILEGALLKLSHSWTNQVLRPGEKGEVQLTISRSAKLALPVRIDLVVPHEIAGLIKFDSLSKPIPSDQSKTKMQFSTRPDSRLVGRWKLKVRAVAMQDQKWPVIAETEFEVDFRNDKPKTR